MRLISLNSWGAKQGSVFFEYVAAESFRTDIFCFQEIYRSDIEPREYRDFRVHLYDELAETLKGFNGFFTLLRDHSCDGKPTDLDINYGLAGFVKKAHQARLVGGIPILPENISKDDGRVLQHLEVENGKRLAVFNFHGLSKPGDKLDTPERIMQSELIQKEVQAVEGPKILCGDFNLMPETRSAEILEQDMVNLIKKFNIKSTRNKVSQSMYPGSPQYYADYIFVSPEIKIKRFEVPYNEVSDHLPMILEFEI